MPCEIAREQFSAPMDAMSTAYAELAFQHILNEAAGTDTVALLICVSGASRSSCPSVVDLADVTIGSRPGMAQRPFRPTNDP